MGFSYAMVVLTSLALFHSGSADIQCFVCNSVRDPFCQDPFSAESEMNVKDFMVVCPVDDEGREPFCRKTITYIERNRPNDMRTHRSCGYLSRKADQCFRDKDDEITVDICECSFDLCNSAGKFSFSLSVALIPIIMSKFM